MRYMLIAALLATGCATSYRPTVTQAVLLVDDGHELERRPFAFSLTPEQCTTLKAERRKYHATQEASTYAVGAGLVCTGLVLGFTDSKTATAVCTGVGGAAQGVSLFTSTQVADLDQELKDGGCER